MVNLQRQQQRRQQQNKKQKRQQQQMQKLKQNEKQAQPRFDARRDERRGRSSNAYYDTNNNNKKQPPTGAPAAKRLRLSNIPMLSAADLAEDASQPPTARGFGKHFAVSSYRATAIDEKVDPNYTPLPYNRMFDYVSPAAAAALSSNDSSGGEGSIFGGSSYQGRKRGR